MNIWGDCEKHKIPLENRYALNGKSYTCCRECEKEQSERFKSMFEEKDQSNA